MLKTKQDARDFKKNKEKEEAMKIADKLKNIKLDFYVKTGKNGKVFGGISSKEISEKLENDYKIKIDKKKIELKGTIKILGITIVEIKLYEGVIGNLKINVISE